MKQTLGNFVSNSYTVLESKRSIRNKISIHITLRGAERRKGFDLVM
jgi:hypothetical protein